MPGKIQSVTRAMRLLMLVASGSTDATGKQLARAAELPVPTAYHLLNTLVQAGLLAKDSKARYLLGVKVAVLADSIQRAVTAPEYLLEPLRRLAGNNRRDVIRRCLAPGRHPGAGVGRRAAARPGVAPDRALHRCARPGDWKAAVGARQRGAPRRLSGGPPAQEVTPRTIVDHELLQAELEQIRANGYAIDEQEFQAGVCCAAAPVVDEGVVVATFSISVPAERFRERRHELVDAVVAIASTLTLPAVRDPARQSA